MQCAGDPQLRRNARDLIFENAGITREDREDGYHLNGRKLKIRGLNRHQSYAYVGYAMPASVQKLDAEILRFDLGVNAVRTSHYPQSQHFIRRCDELGLLVFTEIPGWQEPQNLRSRFRKAGDFRKKRRKPWNLRYVRSDRGIHTKALYFQ